MGAIDLLTQRIIGCAMKVHRALGAGFVESVYHRSLEIELATAGIHFESEKPLSVFYNGRIVGSFVADLSFEGGLIVELKAVEKLARVHEVQVVNYLNAADIETGLLLNFGTSSLQVRRKFRDYKPSKSSCES